MSRKICCYHGKKDGKSIIVLPRILDDIVTGGFDAYTLEVEKSNGAENESFSLVINKDIKFDRNDSSFKEFNLNSIAAYFEAKEESKKISLLNFKKSKEPKKIKVRIFFVEMEDNSLIAFASVETPILVIERFEGVYKAKEFNNDREHAITALGNFSSTLKKEGLI